MTLSTRITGLSLIVAGGLVVATACSDSSGPKQAASCGTRGTQISLAVGAYSSIDPGPDSGCVIFPANASPDSAEYLVLPWSAGGTPATSAPFTLKSVSAAAAPAMALTASLSPARFGGAPSARGPAALAFDRMLRQSARTARYSLPARSVSAAGSVARAALAGPPTVGSMRTFKVCANMACSSFNNVGAVARSVGLHIAIYVDTLAPAPGLSTSDLDSLKTLFDTRLYTLDTLTFGHVSDIDSNTVVIVLMSNTVNKLVTAATCNTSGYVAGFFFPADLAPGISQNYNNGEIFYSIVADSSGTLSCAHKPSEVNNVTPVTFTHEFQHMINFVEHVLVKNGDSEEGWLDEGLSKYAEEIAGRSFGTQDPHFTQFAIGDVFDAYQYLAATGTSALMIPEDTGSLAEIGASWLFTRYIVDQFGDSLPGRLVRTALTGAANVTSQTGQPFAQTVSQWALTNWVSDLPGFTTPTELQYKLWHFRTTYGNLSSQDPTDFPAAYPLVPAVSAGSVVNVSGTLWSGSGVYVRALQGANSAAFTLQLTGALGTVVSPGVIPRLVVLRIR